MLESFRNNMRGIATVIVVLIGGIFALSGTGSLFLSGAGSEAVLVVNNEKVSALAVQQALAAEKRRILSQNENLDAAMLDDELMRPQVIQQIINRKLIAQAAEDQRLGVSSKAVSKLLINAQGFQVDGRFDEDTFLYTIRNQGYTSATFVDRVKEDFFVQQFIQGIIASSFVTEAELANLAQFTEQQRDYHYLTLPIQPIKDSVVPTDEQVSDYYEQNKSQYQTEEQVAVEYIELTPTQLTQTLSVTEEQIKARFEQEVESTDAALHAAHILLTEATDEVIEAIQAKLQAGADFAVLAREYSEDVASSDMGGDLGYTNGEVFPEEFEAALAALAVGQVSAPVETDDGTHFIKLLDIQKQTTDLASERMRIQQELLQEAAGELMVEKLELLKELSYNAESLAVVAEDLGLSVQRTTPFSRAGGDGIAAFPAVIKAAFSSEVVDDQYASEVLDLSNDRYVVIKLHEYFAARQKQLSEVESLLFEALVTADAERIIADQGAALLARVEAGESVEAVAKSADLNWQAAMDVKRTSATVDTEIRSAVFQMSVPVDSPVMKGFYRRNGDYIVAVLDTVTPGDMDKLNTQQRAALIQAVQSANGSREFDAYQASLLAAADIIQ